MDGILEILGYVAVGIFVILNRVFRRKKTNENEYGLTEDGKLKLPFIDQLIEPIVEENEQFLDETEGVDADDILDDPIIFETELTEEPETTKNDRQSNDLTPNTQVVNFTPDNIRQAIIFSEILKPPKSLR